MLIRYTGEANIEFYPKTASTQMKINSPVSLSSGQLIEATSSSLQHVGVLMKDIATTDADYASATLVPVDVPDSDDSFIADVKVGVTALITQIGAQCDFFVDGTSKEVFVDTGTNSHHQVTIVGFISASKVIVKINSLNSMLPAA